MGKTIWLRLRNLYWIKTKSRMFLLTKVMTATESGLTKELANQLAKAALKKPAVHGEYPAPGMHVHPGPPPSYELFNHRQPHHRNARSA